MGNLLARFVGFGMVGGIGFIVDAGILAILNVWLGVDPFSARIIGIACAAFTTWRLNRKFTFDKSNYGQTREGLLYGSVACSIAVLNYAIYTSSIIFGGLLPLLALVLATGLATLISFIAYSKLVFGQKAEIEQTES